MISLELCYATANKQDSTYSVSESVYSCDSGQSTILTCGAAFPQLKTGSESVVTWPI